MNLSRDADFLQEVVLLKKMQCHLLISILVTHFSHYYSSFYLAEAYFVDGYNLAEPEVLLDVTQAACLSREVAEGVIRERLFQDAVNADWQRACEFGVTGVPTFVSGRHGLVGAQPYEALERLIQVE